MDDRFGVSVKTLVYVGANIGDSLIRMINDFDVVYAFEPDPETHAVLKQRIGERDGVQILNYACSSDYGTADFYVTPNRVSSSLADIAPSEKAKGCPEPLRKIQVQTINLGDFLQKAGVERINFYQSDAQGSDLNILRTMSHYVDNRLIDALMLETFGDGVELYSGLDNKFAGFKALLSHDYEFVYASLGRLGGQIVSEDQIPFDENEWDSFWRLRNA